GAPGGPDTWGAIYAAVDAVRALVAGRAADVDTVVAALAVPGPAASPPREQPASANGGGNGDGHPPSATAVPGAAVGPAGAAPVPVGDTVRVPMARLEALMAEVRELHVALSGLRQRAVEARALDKGTSRLGLVLRRRRRRRTPGVKPDRAAAALLRPSAAPGLGAVPDEGLDLIDEMGGLRRRLDGDVRRLEQVAADLHDSVRRLRMVPVGVALAGIPRLVRDTATACGKQARIELLGESTEVDRSVLEGIGGALTHLVRNAVDHGLEEPDRRRRSGKPTIGRVTIDAREERGTLVVEVSDDGGGIDVEAVRRRGVELGLVSAEQAALAGLDLLFRPGFSTAGRITEVSGRGVGLDAVVATVESLQGSVAVRTEDGAGSTFTLTLPLTLATTRSLVLRAAGRTVALPLAAVNRVVRVGAGDIRRSSGRAALTGSGGPVAVAELASVLGFDRGPEPAGGNAAGPPSRLAVIAALGSISAAVLVDEIRGEEEIVVNTLPAPLHRVRFTAGATILGTGEVVPVLHAGEVFRAVAGHRPAGPATAADDGPAPSDRRVVVVADDSVTTRTLERVILESAGYEVRTAADGGQALALVQAGGCDAVVSDVQMPVLDGFGLCERPRADARYRDLPVVLVTALGSRSDRERGVAVGADAYIVKGEFDQETLLATLRRLL
ncbi:MAG TPA: response regulator, partial [Acidimicrobiia bacterium]